MNKTKQLGKDLIDVSFLLSKRAAELTPENHLLLSRYNLGVGGGLLGTPTSVTHDHEGLGNTDEPITPAIRHHRGFQWLEKKEEIQCALQSLMSQLRDKKLPAWLLAMREVQFYESVAGYAGLAFYSPEWKPKTFSKSDKRQAVKMAKSLMTLVKDGIGGLSVLREMKLVGSLNLLIGRLESPSPREYSGPQAREKQLMTGLSSSFLNFEIDNTASIARLVGEIAPALGISLGQKTYERYVDQARSAK